MEELNARARSWIDADPDPSTRAELQRIVDDGNRDELVARMGAALEFGTAGIRGEVGAGPARMNRAVVIRTTFGLVRYLESIGLEDGPVVVGFDARPTSRVFAEDTAGVLAAAGTRVVFFPEPAPTPWVAFAAKRLDAVAAVVVTASHNPPTDNGYKVYGPDAAQIVPPVDTAIQSAIESAPGAKEIPRLEHAFSSESALVREVDADIAEWYWEEVSSLRVRSGGSDLKVVYTPLHGVGGRAVFDVMERAGHTGLMTVPKQAEPDGSFPTVAFPNPEEPGALDLAIEMAGAESADLVVANDPDADRLAVVVPEAGEWRPMSGNEIGVLLADYVLASDPEPDSAIVASSIVSSPMLGDVAAAYGARHESTLTGFKWIVRAGRAVEQATGGRFVFGYEEALGYTVGPTVRDKDGIAAALFFTDLVADLADVGQSPIDRLVELWRRHGIWVSAQVSVTRSGPDGLEEIRRAIEGLGDDPPSEVEGLAVTAVNDYRGGGDNRPEWLGEQALIELTLGDRGRVLARPSGTEPKLKVYVDLREDAGSDPLAQHGGLTDRARGLGAALADSLGL
jgi:phosphomannomutase